MGRSFSRSDRCRHGNHTRRAAVPGGDRGALGPRRASSRRLGRGGGASLRCRSSGAGLAFRGPRAGADDPHRLRRRQLRDRARGRPDARGQGRGGGGRGSRGLLTPGLRRVRPAARHGARQVPAVRPQSQGTSPRGGGGHPGTGGRGACAAARGTDFRPGARLRAELRRLSHHRAPSGGTGRGPGHDQGPGEFATDARPDRLHQCARHRNGQQ